MTRAVKTLVIHSLKIENKDGDRYYKLVAEDIQLQVKVTKKDLQKNTHEDILKAVNDMFLTSLRVLKHTGTLTRDVDISALDKWSQTTTGLAVKVKNDPISEFPRFK